jgi:arylsulfatase A-like enzyme
VSPLTYSLPRGAARGLAPALGLALSACSGSSAPVPQQPTPTPASARPNIVYVLADDQDVQSMPFMPKVKSRLADQGVTFTRSFVTTSLCCPSRASILTGQYPHNHRILSNAAPDGGYEAFLAHPGEASTVAPWLKAVGYRTIFLGKYLNGYPAGDPTHVPPGWDDWHADFARSGEPDSGNYYDYLLNDNGVVTSYDGAPQDYLTDVLTQKAVAAIQAAVAKGPDPFFIYVAPPAPHTPPLPAPRHAGFFSDALAPRSPSFDETDVSDKPAWVQALPYFTPQVEAQIDLLYEARLASMLAVDDMVDRIVQELQADGRLANTFIVFNSDNGFVLGPHRLSHGKEAPYEESIRVPLVVRGPGVPSGQTREQIVANIDIAPTCAEWARASAPDSVDGLSLAALLTASPSAAWRQDLLLEHWQNVTDPDNPVKVRGGIPTFYGLRTADQKTYVEYVTGEIELYDLVADPYQVANLQRHAPPNVIDPLSSRVAALKGCRGATCR